jgi:dihydrofolate reductase
MNRPHWQVMGRRTYAALAALPEEVRDQGWHDMAQTPTVVFSRTLQEVSWPKARINPNDAVAEVPQLKASAEVDLRTIGSLSLVGQLLNAGQVDRLRLMVFPLILGTTGQEHFFAELNDIALELVSETVLDGRVVLCEYRPAGTPPYVS